MMKKQNCSDITDANYHLTIFQSSFFDSLCSTQNQKKFQSRNIFLNIDGLVITHSV